MAEGKRWSLKSIYGNRPLVIASDDTFGLSLDNFVFSFGVFCIYGDFLFFGGGRGNVFFRGV